MRPIDAEMLKEKLSEAIKDAPLYIQVTVDQYIDEAPTLTPPNEPLTLEQLREMDGEPVWDEKGKCYLVDTTYQFCSDSDIEIAIVDKRSIKRYPYRRTLYRRPPEGEDAK